MNKILLTVMALVMLGFSSLNAEDISVNDSALLFGDTQVMTQSIMVMDNSDMLTTEGEGFWSALAVVVVYAASVVINPANVSYAESAAKLAIIANSSKDLP